jgi:hypothetical protein
MAKISKKIKQQISEKLGISNFAGSEQDKVISGLMDNISMAVNIAVLEKLSSQERQEFKKLLNSKKIKKAQAQEFLKSKIGDLDTLAKLTAEQTIKEFLRLTKIK